MNQAACRTCGTAFDVSFTSDPAHGVTCDDCFEKRTPLKRELAAAIAQVGVAKARAEAAELALEILGVYDPHRVQRACMIANEVKR